MDNATDRAVQPLLVHCRLLKSLVLTMSPAAAAAAAVTDAAMIRLSSLQQCVPCLQLLVREPHPCEQSDGSHARGLECPHRRAAVRMCAALHPPRVSRTRSPPTPHHRYLRRHSTGAQLLLLFVLTRVQHARRLRSASLWAVPITAEAGRAVAGGCARLVQLELEAASGLQEQDVPNPRPHSLTISFT